MTAVINYLLYNLPVKYLPLCVCVCGGFELPWYGFCIVYRLLQARIPKASQININLQSLWMISVGLGTQASISQHPAKLNAAKMQAISLLRSSNTDGG